MSEQAQATSPNTHVFQAEVKQLLQLMIHSLYSNKEIFLRELVSNSSDACDKLRFAALKDGSLYGDQADLNIEIETDSDARTITLRDTGIGMSREEIMNNIGTIAKSGTAEFFKKLSGDEAKDSKLIGQFGVGFYSAFIIADKVTLTTLKAGETQAHCWESTGEGEYTLEPAAKTTRGTEVVLHLRDDEDEFLDSWRLRSLITRYSDHVSFPIMMRATVQPSEEEGATETLGDFEQVNNGAPLWTRAKADVTEEEYKEFYKHVSHDFEEPLAWSHNKVEGSLEYSSLLYIPKRAPFDINERDHMKGVKLYVQRVFIMDDAEKLLPQYLRFVRGVIDSNDLPLNVSRELLQGSKVIDKIRSGSVKKVLGLLGNLAKNDADEYQAFWNELGAVLKEGVGEDPSNKESIAKLLRFTSTENDNSDQNVSLVDYVARMKDGQDKIYFITADGYAAAKNSPHLEVFSKQGIEVILLHERVDEWLMAHLTEFDGKSFQSIAKGELDLDAISTDEEKAERKQTEEGAQKLVERLSEILKEKVSDVRVTHRLTESPACLVSDENAMSGNLERLLKEAGQAIPSSKPHLEVNPNHPLVERMDEESDEARFAEWANVLHDQALLAEGGNLENPAAFVRQMNKLLLSMGS